MRAQASMEVFLYFGLLLVILGGLLIWVLDYMNVKAAFAQAYHIYLFEIKVISEIEKISQMGTNSYLRIYLPSSLLGQRYNITITYDGSQKVSYGTLNLGGSEYGFVIRAGLPLGSGSITLDSGSSYLLINKGSYVEVIEE